MTNQGTLQRQLTKLKRHFTGKNGGNSKQIVKERGCQLFNLERLKSLRSEALRFLQLPLMLEKLEIIIKFAGVSRLTFL